MRTLLISAIENMEKSEHMKSLLTKYSLQLCIVSGEETRYILFDGHAPRIVSEVSELNDVVIEGDRESLTQLFRGDDFLLAMKNREEIAVSGSLNHLLWLESLFYLKDG